MTDPAIINFITTDTPTIIRSIATYLNPTINQADQHTQLSTTTKFHAQSKPTINTHDYLARLINLCPLTIDGVLLGLVYLHRITTLTQQQQQQPTTTTTITQLIPINSLTIHRLLLSSMILGTKFISDRPLPRKRLSKVAGISEIELDHLERELLNRLDFKLCWSNHELIQLTRLILNQTILPPTITTTTTTKTTPTPSPSSTLTNTNPKAQSHRASFSTSSSSSSSNTNTNPGPTEINTLLRRHSTSRGLVFVKSQFINSNFLAEKYGLSSQISTRSTTQIIDNLLENTTNSLINQTDLQASHSTTKPRSTSQIIVTRLERNQIKICHTQVF